MLINQIAHSHVEYWDAYHAHHERKKAIRPPTPSSNYASLESKGIVIPFEYQKGWGVAGTAVLVPVTVSLNIAERSRRNMDLKEQQDRISRRPRSINHVEERPRPKRNAASQ